MSVTSERPTQHQRSSATKAAINGAVIQCLIESGYSGTTMSAVTSAAGVSRGAITHQYASKREMLIAAIEDLSLRYEVELRAAAADLPSGAERPRSVLGLLWAAYRSELFFGILELWNAARTDPELLAVLQVAERDQGRWVTDLLAELFGPAVAEHPNFSMALDMTQNLMRGVALTSILRDNVERENHLLDQWTALFLDLTS